MSQNQNNYGSYTDYEKRRQENIDADFNSMYDKTRRFIFNLENKSEASELLNVARVFLNKKKSQKFDLLTMRNNLRLLLRDLEKQKKELEDKNAKLDGDGTLRDDDTIRKLEDEIYHLERNFNDVKSNIQDLKIEIKRKLVNFSYDSGFDFGSLSSSFSSVSSSCSDPMKLSYEQVSQCLNSYNVGRNILEDFKNTDDYKEFIQDIDANQSKFNRITNLIKITKNQLRDKKKDKEKANDNIRRKNRNIDRDEIRNLLKDIKEKEDKIKKVSDLINRIGSDNKFDIIKENNVPKKEQQEQEQEQQQQKQRQVQRGGVKNINFDEFSLNNTGKNGVDIDDIDGTSLLRQIVKDVEKLEKTLKDIDDIKKKANNFLVEVDSKRSKFNQNNPTTSTYPEKEDNFIEKFRDSTFEEINNNSLFKRLVDVLDEIKESYDRHEQEIREIRQDYQELIKKVTLEKTFGQYITKSEEEKKRPSVFDRIDNEFDPKDGDLRTSDGEIFPEKNRSTIESSMFEGVSEISEWRKKLEKKEKELKEKKKVLDEEEDKEVNCPSIGETISETTQISFKKNVVTRTMKKIERFLKILDKYERKLENGLETFLEVKKDLLSKTEVNVNNNDVVQKGGDFKSVNPFSDNNTSNQEIQNEEDQQINELIKQNQNQNQNDPFEGDVNVQGEVQNEAFELDQNPKSQINQQYFPDNELQANENVSNDKNDKNENVYIPNVSNTNEKNEEYEDYDQQIKEQQANAILNAQRRENEEAQNENIEYNNYYVDQNYNQNDDLQNNLENDVIEIEKEHYGVREEKEELIKERKKVRELREKLKKKMKNLPKEQQTKRDIVLDTIDHVYASITNYRNFQFDFIGKRIRSADKYIENWRSNPEFEVVIEKFKSDLEKYDEKKQICVKRAYDFGERYVEKLKNEMKSYFRLNDWDVNLREYYFAELNQFELNVTLMSDKISIYYNQGVKFKHLVFDRETIMLSFLKVVNFVCLIFSVYITENIFRVKCMNKNSALVENPPNLYYYILICYGIHTSFILMVLTILILTSFMLTVHPHTPLINIHFIILYLKDYVTSIFFHIIFSLIYAYAVQKKKYFRYKLESFRGIRSTTDFMILMALLIYVLPYFVIYWSS